MTDGEWSDYLEEVERRIDEWGGMQMEATITVNGNALTEMESKVVRLALESMSSTMKQMGFEDDGIALTDAYMVALSRLRAYLEGR